VGSGPALLHHHQALIEESLDREDKRSRPHGPLLLLRQLPHAAIDEIVMVLADMRRERIAALDPDPLPILGHVAMG